MIIEPLKSFITRNGSYSKGFEKEVSDKIGKELIKLGVAKEKKAKEENIIKDEIKVEKKQDKKKKK